jgi:hypothetical protein
MITISENTKNYIKSLLSEAGGPRGKQHFSPKPGVPGATGDAPVGTAGGMYSPHPSDISIQIRKKRQEAKGQFGMDIDRDILMGRTSIGNAQDTMDHIAQMSQGYATAEYLDSVMPAAAKAAMALNLWGKSPGVKGKQLKSSSSTIDLTPYGVDPNTAKVAKDFLNPSSASASPSGTQTAPKPTGAPSSASSPQQKAAAAEERAAKDKKDQFVSLTKKFAANLGSLDPFNPLLGIKLGYELLGGKEILKRTRELGAAQSAGVQSSMGHPSAIGRF